MAGQNQLNAVRRAFQIPESVTIIAGASLLPPKPSTPAKSPNFQIDQTVTADPELYRSALGTPVFTDITLGDPNDSNANSWTDNNGVLQTFEPITLQAVLITVNQTKKIIKTEIQGRDGTVKEYIGMGDFEVGINGLLTGGNGHYPIDDVSQLKTILNAPIPIVVSCTFLQNIDIHNLVIEDYDISQKEGGYSYQTFSITCSSDVPQELRLTSV